MSAMMMALLTAFGANLGAQADGCCAAEKKSDAGCCTSSLVTVGKHYERRYHCVEPKASTPTRVRIEVKPEDRKPGDDEGFKTVGKHLEKAYYRWVDAPQEVAGMDCTKAGSKEACSYGMFPVGKQLVRKSFCERNGERVMCGDKSGECAVCLN